MDLLLIAGDLFHRQPLLRELKEVRYLFEKLTATQVVLIAGNHDYMKSDSYYRTFRWPEHVHMLTGETMQIIDFPNIHTSVCGCSYHTREKKEKLDIKSLKKGQEPFEILLLHGGDESHIPFTKEDLIKADFDYIALGHIHKPQIIIEGKAAYSGALEPIDKNDVGEHGYILGEITDQGCDITFVPVNKRSYIHKEMKVTPEFTENKLREEIENYIQRNGNEHFYKFILNGFRDPDISFDSVENYFDLRNTYTHRSSENQKRNILEIVDETQPSYDFAKLKEQHEDDILGAFIEAFSEYPSDSMEHRALCEGVQAMMDTRKG